MTYELEAIVPRPDDGLPHPLAVLNHGSPRSAEARPAGSAKCTIVNVNDKPAE